MHSVLATYDSSRPFIPWLMAIIRNRLVDAARRHGRQHAHETQVDDIQVTFGDAATNTAEEGMGDVELLQQAIRALPAGQRQAIELIKLQELSLKEASEATGASVTALKVATHRAIVSLRRILGVSSDEH
jgi:RNA polymerase sigma-70 factor (ECF subfamily)